jgi:hypothetical protein
MVCSRERRAAELSEEETELFALHAKYLVRQTAELLHV